MTEHGGNIYRFSELSDIPLRKVTDFSASINPLGVPKSVSAAIKNALRMLPHYPDPDAKKLTKEIARRYKVRPESIICGNGSTELIYLTARTLNPRNVLIPSPTFSEYERACKMSPELQVASCKLTKDNNFDIEPNRFIDAMEKMVYSAVRNPQSRNMAFICNPNNPTGRLISRNGVLEIADAARELRCYLVVDEAFIDFVPHASVYEAVQNNPYLIVLRSMTKFYALSGLRIGYGVFPLSLAGLIRKYKEPWTVNTLAQEAGAAAINDRDYTKKTFLAISEEKRFIEESFKKLKIDFVPSAANYYLIKVNDSGKTVRSLQSKGILVRDCSNFKGLDNKYIRVAVKSRRGNALLLKELSNSAKE